MLSLGLSLGLSFGLSLGWSLPEPTSELSIGIEEAAMSLQKARHRVGYARVRALGSMRQGVRV